MRFLLLVVAMAVSGCGLTGRPFKHLLKDGTQAVATVTALDQTGTIIGENPVCNISLAVQPKQGEPFRTSVRQVVLLVQLAQLQPGTVVTVRYNEQKHEEAIIEGLGRPPAVTTDEARTMALAGDALRAELNAPGVGVEATGIVEKLEDTGVMVDGPNPLAIMSVKVLPSQGAPYDATIQGVFAPAGLHKYQPGREVFLYVDPKDPQRVTINTAKMKALP